jgi:glycosyltransferase involved in cell wall biosynthesis
MFIKKPIQAFLSFLFCDGIVVNSQTAAERIKTIRVRRHQKIFTIMNAVGPIQNSKRISREEISDKYSIDQDAIWLVTMGRLVVKKRLDLLLKAIALIKNEHQDFYLLVMGDGPQRKPLETLAENLKINKEVIFIGEILSGEKWLSAMDIFCFTSLHEGMPNVVTEAAASGVPVIGWRVPFLEEITDNGRYAALVQPEDLVGYKEELLRLMQTPNYRNQLGCDFQNHVLNQFSENKNTFNMTRIYEEILGLFQESMIPKHIVTGDE